MEHSAFGKALRPGERESDVIGRYKKIGGSLEESARGAQRGLLLILGSALIWALALWVGYHYL